MRTLFLLLPAVVQAEYTGNVATELRYFPNRPIDARQQEENISFSVEPEYYTRWDNNDQSLNIKLFARYDQHDSERTHADIRELMYITVARSWELRAGIGKVFWGVTESQHLVDIINQTDAVENLDLEEKLGQPMLDLTLISDYGNFDFFVLPYFRERTFAGIEGRPRSQPRVDADLAVYQSDKQQKHIDYAARWTRTLDEWDLGLSYFNGTSRDPRLTLAVNRSGETVFQPHYDLIKQVGLDIQGTFDAWLWKLEVIHREGAQPDYTALTGGFEYTLYDIRSSGADLGFLLEYLYDDRSTAAPTPFQDDVLLGLRYTFNDVQSSEILFGQIIDRHTHATSYNLEASRRLTDHFKLNIESRFFTNPDSSDPAYAYRNDDYVQVELVYYY